MMSPAGGQHGWMIMNISAPVATYVREHDLGYVFGAETGFFIERDPDTVRAPDFAFVRKDRIAGSVPIKFFPGAPDLAVEVFSPSDYTAQVQAKADSWLNCGCAEVWLVDPRGKTASRCLLRDGEIVVNRVNVLESDLLPGFELQVAALFR
jgi:Uma2 family endonuclease